jgi:hypothetical protein
VVLQFAETVFVIGQHVLGAGDVAAQLDAQVGELINHLLDASLKADAHPGVFNR